MKYRTKAINVISNTGILIGLIAKFVERHYVCIVVVDHEKGVSY